MDNNAPTVPQADTDPEPAPYEDPKSSEEAKE